jgi:hypothetical protein
MLKCPLCWKKATINVGAAGTMTVIIVDKDFSNTIIASRTINVTLGVSEYTVNLFVPKAGKNYGIQVLPLVVERLLTAQHLPEQLTSRMLYQA